jgi:hypothetical protein
MNRRSTAITLFLVGACIAACDGDQRHRAFYRTKEECLKDWGTETSCQQSTGPNGGSYYYGPWYNHSSGFWGRGGGAAPGIVSEGGGSVSSSSEAGHFGGFGESAGAHGGVGE